MSIALAVGLVSPSQSFAQEEPESGASAADKETARTLFKEGDEKFRAGDYEGARKAFAAADGIMGVPTTGLEHARSLMKLGKLLEARDLFLKVANRKKLKDELDAQDVARAEATQLANDMADRIPAVRVAISNTPDGAEVKLRIDDVIIPAAAVEFPRKVNPGKHTVKLFVAGFEPVSRTVEVAEGEEEVVEVTLESSGDGASLVDPWKGGNKDPEGGDEGLPVLSWIGFSLAAAGTIVGTITGVYAVVKRGELQDDCPETICPKEFEGELDTAVTVSHVSTASFIVAGVGVVVGVMGLLVRSSLPDALAGADAPLTLRPYVGPMSAGFTGTF